MVMFSKTRVSLAQIDVTPNYRPSSYNSSFSQLVPALVVSPNDIAKSYQRRPRVTEGLWLSQWSAHCLRKFSMHKAGFLKDCYIFLTSPV